MSDKAKILVVDDSAIVLEHARDLLEGAGYQVVTCSEPQNARHDYAREQPNLVMIDVDMPKVNGGELLSRLRDEYVETPAKLIFFSVSTEEELAELSQNTGADGFICKSWPQDQLLQYLSDQLGGGGQD